VAVIVVVAVERVDVVVSGGIHAGLGRDKIIADIINAAQEVADVAGLRRQGRKQGRDGNNQVSFHNEGSFCSGWFLLARDADHGARRLAPPSRRSVKLYGFVTSIASASVMRNVTLSPFCNSVRFTRGPTFSILGTPNGPSTSTMCFSAFTERILTVTSFVSAITTPGMAPLGATLPAAASPAFGGALDLRTTTATDSSIVAFTLSPTLIWSKFLTAGPNLYVFVM